MKDHRFRLYKVLALAVILVISIFMTAACSEGSGGSEEEVAEAVNPLTGATVSEGFDENSLNQRTVAFVVENAPEARPQFNMDDPELSPDIVLEGEVEAGITRMLWLYADYNKLPERIGPMRSARPPYIRFSELFDSVFIHWGQSASKGAYVGADTVFEQDEVDHINQTEIADKTGLALEEAAVRMEPKDYTHLDFSKLAWLVSVKPAQYVRVTYSDRAAWERTAFTYDPEDQKYHTGNFQNDFSRDNLLILFDKTEYVEKENYKGEVGASVTYCDYALGGGKGYLMSQGTYKDIEWRIEDGKLVLIDVEATKALQEKAAAEAESEEAEDKADDEEAGPVEARAYLYPGKTWIGWVSSNNGGAVDIAGSAEETSAAE